MTQKHYTEEQLQAMVQPLFNTMSRRVSPADMDTLHRAFDLARRAHAGQWRKTGEPYIIHPIAVARIVGEELCLDTNPVCAAFLHDVVEDSDYTIEQIEEMFGSDIAFLVRVVTKRKSGRFETSKQVDNFRQMLESVKYDIRALLIKLADRLHNMRTLSSMPPDKQMKIAGETDYFYAPLANRLGLYRVKIELENLSFRYRCPREYAHLEELLRQEEEANRPVLDEFMTKVAQKLRQKGFDAYIEVEYRRPFSIRRKMQKSGRDFQHVENKHFIRIVFGENRGNMGISEKSQALRIYALLTDEFKEKPGGMLNYIDSPKENGYQSLHAKLLNSAGQWEEVHISSERMRRISRLGCVAEQSDTTIARWIDRLKQTLQDIAYHNHEIGFMEGVVSSFYNDDITVFTPQGRAISLPQRSTALDFAFEVHSDVGLHAQFARINGKLCSVKTPLQRGDCVEIGTSATVKPKRDWLDSVLTYKAKRHLISYLNKQPEPLMIRCEHCHPLPGDEVIGFRGADGRVAVHKRDCRVVISQASQSGDSVVAVDFRPEPGELYPVKVHVRAIDRFHLLSDMIECITNQLRLPMASLCTRTQDEIAEADIEFSVHSFEELQTVVSSLNAIEGVDEVQYTEQ